MGSIVPNDPAMSSEVRSFLESQGQALKSAAADIANLGTAAALDVGTLANNVVQLNGSALLPAVDGSQLLNLPAQTGRLIAGTPLVLNPYAGSGTTTQAHGLGTTPVLISRILECLTANLNYSVSDKVEITSLSFQSILDATNVVLVRSSAAVQLPDKTGFGLNNITNGSWKLTVTPYKLT